MQRLPSRPADFAGLMDREIGRRAQFLMFSRRPAASLCGSTLNPMPDTAPVSAV